MVGFVMNKIKLCPDLSCSTVTKLYDSMVNPISFYAAGVWNFKNDPNSNDIQDQAMRCFPRLHKLTAKRAIEKNMG